MKDFKKLQDMDRRMRELAGLYAAEKERADKLEAELRAIRENRAGDVVVAESETTTATCKDSLQVGNAAKMREALKYLRDASREFCHLILNSKHNEIFDKYKYKEVAKISDAIANAGITLNAPPRNCDVGTAEDQEVRFRNYCWNHSSRDKNMECQCTIDTEGRAGCKLEWAQMPYGELKG